MKLSLVIVFVFLLGFGKAGSTDIDFTFKVNQTKDHYLILEINKYESEYQINELLRYLNSQAEKISTATFNYEDRHLTVYYSSNLGVDDICRMVLLFYQDFNKISGTEL